MAKKWGKGEYWGLGSEFDPDWMLTESQKKLRDDLIDLCRRKIRPLATENDKNYIFPRESMNALTELGLLGLLVPKEYGGLGENHTCLAMVIETLSRYGCPSTAMVYTMHSIAVIFLLLRYDDNKEVQDLVARLDKDKKIGTLVYSDPATGSHFWFQVTCKTKLLDEDTIQILKYGSWCTSAGHADWYVVSVTSPDFQGDHSDTCNMLFYKDEVRANNDDWVALGMHGNMSGPLVIEGKFSRNRIIGKIGDGHKLSDEIAPVFMLVAAACWNGISLSCMDIAKKHVTRKTHADVGMRICDYVTIQDYFGDCLSETTASRMLCFSNAKALDETTKNNSDWSLYSDPNYAPRVAHELWMWQTKYVACKNVYKVSDVMLQTCGGTGYKTDLGLERVLRDGKAGWVMAPSNEVMRNFVGKVGLLGMDSVDFWEHNANDRVVHHELQKMSLEKKKALVKSLNEDISANEGNTVLKHPFQDTDFENPFNTCPPAVSDQSFKTQDGVIHQRALQPNSWTTLTLLSRKEIADRMASFEFALPNKTDHTGCLPGQYVEVKVVIDGKEHSRFFSPVSRPDDFGHIVLVLRFETHGIMSDHFKSLKPGDTAQFQGPCGGFEYEANRLDQLTLLASGGGITPGMQLIRSIMKNPKDRTKINLVYYSEDCDNILYKDELDQYAAEDPRLNILYTVGSAPEDWEGEEGFIDTEMLDKHLIKPNGLKHKIVLCGGATMAIACLHSLKNLGFPSHFIFIYGQFGIQLMKMVFGKNIKFSGHTCSDI